MKTIEEYLALPYTMTVRWSAEDELYVARVKEIDGCTGHGATEVSAIGMLRDNLEDWIAFSLERGDLVPIPRDTELPSGKWVQRVSRSLHKLLIERASEEGVSLNTYVTTCLAQSLGRQAAVAGAKVAIQRKSGDLPSVYGLASSIPLRNLRTSTALSPLYMSGGCEMHSGHTYWLPESNMKGAEPIVYVSAPLLVTPPSRYVSRIAEQFSKPRHTKQERRGNDKQEALTIRAYA